MLINIYLILFIRLAIYWSLSKIGMHVPAPCYLEDLNLDSN